MDEKRALIGVSQGVGNIIHMTPLIAAVKWLGYSIDIFATSTVPKGYECINDMNYINRLFIDSSQIKPSEYDVGILGMWAQGVVDKCKKVIRPRISDQSKYHESEINFDCAVQLGYKDEMPHTWTAMAPIKFDFDRKGKKVVVIHPARHWNKIWSKKWYPYWNELVKELSKDYNIVVVGTKMDKIDSLSEYYAGELELSILSKLILFSDLFISSDSGISHLSAATGQKTLVLWGPTSLIKNRPLGNNVQILRNNKTCPDGKQSPCQVVAGVSTRYIKCKNNICMHHPIDVVVEKVREMI